MKKLRIQPLSLTWWGMMIGSILYAAFLSRYPQHMRAAGIFSIIFFILYKYALYKTPDFAFNIWDELPLAFCNINGFYFTYGVFTGNQVFLSYCLLLETVATLMALLMPISGWGFEDALLFSGRGLGFYGYHFVLLAQGLSILPSGIFHPSYDLIPKMCLLAACTLIFAHIVNWLLRKKKLDPIANYCYTYGLDTNPVLRALKKIVNINCVYLFLLMPVASLIYLILFAILI